MSELFHPVSSSALDGGFIFTFQLFYSPPRERALVTTEEERLFVPQINLEVLENIKKNLVNPNSYEMLPGFFQRPEIGTGS